MLKHKNILAAALFSYFTPANRNYRSSKYSKFYTTQFVIQGESS